MLKRLATAAAAGAFMSMPALAFDINAMEAREREAFRAEIRTYLLDHPEVLLEAITVLEERKSNEQASTDIELVAANADLIFNDGHSWVGGNPDGDVTIVEFLDYRCGFCRRAHPEISELIASDGNIRYIVKEFPILGAQSVLASSFALAVKRVEGNDAYSEAHDALITMRSEVSERSLSELSKRLGHSRQAVMNAMNSEPVHLAINQNRALAQRLGIGGTPSFVVGDQMVRGYIPLERMQGIISEYRGNK